MAVFVKCPECGKHHNILHGDKVICSCGHLFDINKKEGKQ